MTPLLTKAQRLDELTDYPQQKSEDMPRQGSLVQLAHVFYESLGMEDFGRQSVEDLAARIEWLQSYLSLPAQLKHSSMRALFGYSVQLCL